MHVAFDRLLQHVARAPVLLVASDYDGTLAALVDDPALAGPHRESIVALERLAALPRTSVAVVSGRSLADLARLSGLSSTVHMVGSHGREFDSSFASSIAPELLALRDELERQVAAIVAGAPGTLLERKPASVAFHYRNAAPAVAERALAEVRAAPAAHPEVHVKHGKQVVELALVATDKGVALERLRAQVGATATLFIGDDITDEDAFATLRGPDLAVKVGPGDSIAPHRVESPEQVAFLLARLCELRTDWICGGDAVEIEHHSLLSDQRTLALVTPAARVTWLCLPRVDSTPIFAELLGGPAAGYFAVGPAEDIAPIGQRYSRDSLVLETSWPSLTVVDLLDCSGGRFARSPGRADLVRIVRGRGRVRVEFAPMLDYGRMPVDLAAEPDGLRILGGPDPLVLRAPGLDWRIAREARQTVARAETDLGAEGELVLELRYGTADLGPGRRPASERESDTRAYWRHWARRLRVPPIASDAVRRSALVLKALCHGPTGAILAAGTTSLPEHVGGVRNWDYRFCWPRDASLAAAALVRLESTDEAMAFLDWLLGVCATLPSSSRLRPLYTVDRGMVHDEAEIGELSGYRGSRPVRVGNTAVHQVQLDVFGPIVELVHRLFEFDAPLSSEHWKMVEGMAAAVVERWREPDHGIWEERLVPRHHVYSKIMGWLTLDRAARLARALRGRAREDWEAVRDTIREDVLTHGYDEKRGCFTGAYGGDYVDASALHVGLSGLLAPDDPRFTRTVEAVETELRDGPTVYRYLVDDGLPGHEGGFHLCAGWLVEAYRLVGRRDDAFALFEAWTELAGPTGLLSEQYDAETGLALGNHPQAYSHTALIENACSLAESEASP